MERMNSLHRDKFSFLTNPNAMFNYLLTHHKEPWIGFEKALEYYSPQQIQKRKELEERKAEAEHKRKLTELEEEAYKAQVQKEQEEHEALIESAKLNPSTLIQKQKEEVASAKKTFGHDILLLKTHLSFLETSHKEELEKVLHALIYETFDGFIGTSIGGAISLMIASKQKTAKELVEFFTLEENISRIFTSNSFWGIRFSGPRYNGKSKADLLKSVFGNKKMLEVQKLTLVPAYNFINNRLHIFRTDGGFASKKSDPFVYEVAATIYFPPVEIKNEWFIDAAIGINNPALLGVAHGFSKNYTLEDIHILSVGINPDVDFTLTNPKQVREYGIESQGWTELTWPIIGNLPGEFMAANISSTQYIATRLLKDNYCRVDGTEIVSKLDYTSDANITKLKQLGKEWYQKHEASIIEWLRKTEKLKNTK